MLIDETMVTLTQATKMVPSRRPGKAPEVSTLHRWATRGLRGVRLETIKVGGARMTSREALERFFQALTQLDLGRYDQPAAPPVDPPVDPARDARVAAARARLEAAGI